MEAIIVALITGICGIIGQFAISKKGKKDRLVQEAVKEEKMNNRLSAIEDKLDIHNGYAEKLSAVQQDIAVIKAEISNLKEQM